MQLQPKAYHPSLDGQTTVSIPPLDAAGWVSVTDLSMAVPAKELDESHLKALAQRYSGAPVWYYDIPALQLLGSASPGPTAYPVVLDSWPEAGAFGDFLIFSIPSAQRNTATAVGERQSVQKKKVVSLAEARRRSIASLHMAEERRAEASESEARLVESFHREFDDEPGTVPGGQHHGVSAGQGK